jgi:glycerophosphoryl diester phosphodiesterase
MHWFTSDTPLIIAHRGASGYETENTIAACHLAAEQDADGFELDVQLSADGVPVIIHDFTVDRITNGTGAVSDLTLSELRTLDMPGGHTIPTLDEMFEAIGPNYLYNLEIKEKNWFGQGASTVVAERVRYHRLDKQVLLSSFNPFTVRRARRAFTPATPVALIRAPGAFKYTYLLAVGAADHPHFTLVDDNYMRWAARKGYRVHVWTVDDPAEARRLAQLGVHGIITNKPDIVRGSL